MSGAAAAAAAQARRMRQEEEELTPYRRDDLDADWEFKILRSMTGAFKRAATLRRVLEEEAQAGWVLVEKFDNGRLRLKRPASCRESDANLSFDAYRTYIGPSEGQFAAIIVAGMLGGMAIVAAVIAAVVALT